MIELLKFTRTTYIRFIVLFLVLVSVFFPLYFIFVDTVVEEYSTGKVVNYKGMEGLKIRKKQMEKVKGKVTTERLNVALKDYQKNVKKLKDKEKAFFFTESAYPDYQRMIKSAFIPISYVHRFQMDTQKNTNDFYQQIIPRAKEQAEILPPEKNKEALEKSIKSRAELIKTPFTFDFYEQWMVLIKSLYISYFLLGFFSIFIATGAFSFESEKRMHLIIASCSTKKLRQIALKKCMAIWGFVSVLFFLLTILIVAIVLGIMGTSGGQVSLQTLPRLFCALYPWTASGFVIRQVLLAWICLLGVTGISLLMDALFQKRFISLVLSAIVLVLPLFLGGVTLFGSSFQKIIGSQPMIGFNLLDFILDPRVYLWGAFSGTKFAAVFITATLYVVLTIIATPFIFSHQLREHAWDIKLLKKIKK